MIKALYTSATGMNAQQTVIDNTANNLANVNTTGFKKGQADFQDLIYVTERVPGSEAAQGLQVPTGLQVGSGVRIAGITKIFTPGALVNTGNPLDIAIEGDGFLSVSMPNGDTRYTRDGALRLNAVGNLVTSDGFLISPQVTIPQDALSVAIGADGTISVQNPGSPTPTSVGQLTLVRFPNPPGLSAEGRNLFAETASSGAAEHGDARIERHRDFASRISRTLQRGRGDGTRQPDPGPTSLRIQHAQHSHGRQHAQRHLPTCQVISNEIAIHWPIDRVAGCHDLRGAAHGRRGTLSAGFDRTSRKGRRQETVRANGVDRDDHGWERRAAASGGGFGHR